MPAVQDERRAGKVKGKILGGESHEEEKSQSWDPTRLHPWCEDNYKQTSCSRDGIEKDRPKTGGKELSKIWMVRGTMFGSLKILGGVENYKIKIQNQSKPGLPKATLN